MPKFSKAELLQFYDAEVPDLVSAQLKLLFVGINPGLWTAAVQTHFAHPVNRFYPALNQAGIFTEVIDPYLGMTTPQKQKFLASGLGLSNVVPRATARADELSKAEIQAGGQRLISLIEELRPKVVAIAGITAYRTAYAMPKAAAGEQQNYPPNWPTGVRLWVSPNPSGLNARESVASLAAAYAEPARAAGVIS